MVSACIHLAKTRTQKHIRCRHLEQVYTWSAWMLPLGQPRCRQDLVVGLANRCSWSVLVFVLASHEDPEPHVFKAL